MKNESTLENLLGYIRAQTIKAIQDAEKKGKQQERERILFLIKSARNGYNAERGGQFCSKPYLQKHNMRVEIMDEIIQSIEHTQ